MSEWISVKEKTPRRGELIIAYMNGFCEKYVDIVCYDPKYSVASRTITHWMPLPESPKEE